LATENYFLDAYVYKYDTLVVTFEPFNAALPSSKFRSGWGSEFLRSQQISHLCIKPKISDWYRKADLITAIKELKAAGFFRPFRRIVTYGGSMGGFAALAFADLIGATYVFSLNPQSTLDPQKVPWETRFRRGQREDWSGHYTEAADGIHSVKQVYIAVDMRDALDRRHVDRIRGRAVEILNMPFVGHFMPRHLKQTGLLQSTLVGIMREEFDLDGFRKKARGRRKLAAYYDGLLSRDRVARSERFRTIVNHHKDHNLTPERK